LLRPSPNIGSSPELPSKNPAIAVPVRYGSGQLLTDRRARRPAGHAHRLETGVARGTEYRLRRIHEARLDGVAAAPIPIEFAAEDVRIDRILGRPRAVRDLRYRDRAVERVAVHRFGGHGSDLSHRDVKLVGTTPDGVDDDVGVAGSLLHQRRHTR